MQKRTARYSRLANNPSEYFLSSVVTLLPADTMLVLNPLILSGLYPMRPYHLHLPHYSLQTQVLYCSLPMLEVDLLRLVELRDHGLFLIVRRV